MANSKNIQVWSWRIAIEKCDLKPMTKLVLYTLANYMNDHGKGCYPSVASISTSTGLSERRVFVHIKTAIDLGFLIKKKRNVKGSKWASNEYEAAYPYGVTLAAPQLENGVTLESKKALGHDASVMPGVTPASGLGCRQRHTNSPVNSPINSPYSTTGCADDNIENVSSKTNEDLKNNDFSNVAGKLQEIIASPTPMNMMIVRKWLKLYEADFVVEAIANWKTQKPNHAVHSMKYFDHVLSDAKEVVDSPAPVSTAKHAGLVPGQTWAEQEIERLTKLEAQND